MIFNSSIAVLKGIRADFAKKLTQDVGTSFDFLMEKIQSGSNKEIYAFFDSTPEIKEWLDKIDYSKFKMFEFEFRNIPWQWGIPVKRETIEDSQDNGLQPSILRHINSGVQKWQIQPLKLLNDLLTNGTSGLCFDGTAFFADSRPNIQGSNTIDNIVTGSGVDTIAHITTDYVDALGKLESYKDKNGDPINVGVKPVLFIPSHLRSVFETLRVSQTLSAATGAYTNIWANGFDIVVNPYQSITNNDWYMIDSNAVMKPFIFQSRKEPIFNMKDEQDDPMIKYYSVARRAMGYGMPTSIVFVNN